MDIWTLIATGLMTFIGGFSGWFFGRKKQQAETVGIDIQNANQIIEMYKGLTLQIKTEFDNAQQLIEQQQTLIEKFRTKCSQAGKCGI